MPDLRVVNGGTVGTVEAELTRRRRPASARAIGAQKASRRLCQA